MNSRTSFFEIPLALFLGSVLLGGCGAKSRASPAPPPRIEIPTEASVGPTDIESGEWLSNPPPGSLTAEQAAPSPRVRIGLTTEAEVVRLTSSLPIRIHAGGRWLLAHELVVERQLDVELEGRVYTVQVGSFLTGSGAQRVLKEIREDTHLQGRIVREPVTGRHGVRVGSWGTSQAAMEMAYELARQGFESSRVVVEPSRSSRPVGLILRRGAQAMATSELSLVALPASRGHWVEVDGSPYRGLIEISVNASNRLTLVNVANLEDYLKGVVPAELSSSVYPEREAIKAQAVAARTYALRHLGQYASEGFDLCDTPACQVYRGVDVEEALGSAAIEATAGQVLTYGGQPIDALYTSTCGGRTEEVQNVFEGPARPYLVSRRCFSEDIGFRLSATAGLPLSLPAAGALVLGLVDEKDLHTRSLLDPASGDEVSRWSMRSIEQLGQTMCEPVPTGDGPLTWVEFAGHLTRALCWEGRLPFLVSETDSERLIPSGVADELSDFEHRALAYFLQEGWLKPPEEGLPASRPMTRQEVLESLVALVSGRGEPMLREATVSRLVDGRVEMAVDGLQELFPLSVNRYLYRKVHDNLYPVSELLLLAGDHVLFHRDAEGVDLLVLSSQGSDFDRSSRFSRWTIRKTADELTGEVNELDLLGDVTELRPRRYGPSGRVVELEVVGSRGSMTLRGLEIRRRLGVRENLFFCDRQVAPGGRVEAWVFTGRGWGHGVGLCQVGAYGMAVAGYDYRQILSHYYPGTEIALWSDAGLQ